MAESTHYAKRNVNEMKRKKLISIMSGIASSMTASFVYASTPVNESGNYEAVNIRRSVGANDFKRKKKRSKAANKSRRINRRKR